jgi:hypothetical protein
MRNQPIYSLKENIEVSLYELNNLRNKFDVPDHSNIGRHFKQIEEYLNESLYQVIHQSTK